LQFSARNGRSGEKLQMLEEAATGAAMALRLLPGAELFFSFLLPEMQTAPGNRRFTKKMVRKI
jgi:hypothetical protein